MSKITRWKPSGTVLYRDAAAQEESYCVSDCSPPCLCKEPNLRPQPWSAELPKPTVWLGTERGWEPAKAPATPWHTGVRACLGVYAAPLSPSAPLWAWLDFGLILSAWEVVTEVTPKLHCLVLWISHFIKSDGLGCSLTLLLLWKMWCGRCWVLGLAACKCWYPACCLWHMFFLRHQSLLEAQFGLESSVSTQGRCAMGLCWGPVKSQQRDIPFSCRLWREGSLPLLNLPLALGWDGTWHLQSQAGGRSASMSHSGDKR